MRHVTEVVSNLKCGAKAPLALKTLIVGPNGAGKSAIVNAVELALSGTASDVAGRRDATSEAILRALLPANEPGRAWVGLDDGTTGEWVLGPEGRAARTGTSAAFPLREVYENLLGTAATAQKWLLRLMGKGELPTIVESLARQSREAATGAKALRSAATSQAAGLPPEPDAATIEAAKLRGTAAEMEAAEAGLTAAEELLAAADAALIKAQKERDTAPEGNEALVRNGQSIITIIDAQIAAKATIKCGLCAGATTLEALTARRTAVESRIAGARTAAEKHTALIAAVDEARHAKGVAEADAAFALRTVKALREVAKGALPVEIIRLQERWASVRALVAQAEAAEVNAAALAAREKSEKENLDREADKAIAGFVAKVQAYLPPEDSFGLEFDPPRFGLRRDGVLHAALSGAEWARVTAALAAAASDSTKINVVIPEERAFDPDTLSHVLRAFNAIPCQVIVASPIAPTVVPDGWSVVRVGGTGFLGWVEPDAVRAAEDALTAPEALAADEEIVNGLVESKEEAVEKIKEIAERAGAEAAGEPGKKRRGRPPGVKNKPKPAAEEVLEGQLEIPAGEAKPLDFSDPSLFD